MLPSRTAACYLACRFVYSAFSVYTAIYEERGLQGVHILPGAIYFTKAAHADVAIIMILHTIRFLA